MHRPDLEILVLIRGGGSFENLKVFHSEKIADAIATSRIPVVTGIGHEQDISIADLEADKFCSTPTAVAVFLRTQRETLIRALDTLGESLALGLKEVFAEKNRAFRISQEYLQTTCQHLLKHH